MSLRIKKINDLVRDSLAEIILQHLSLKKGVFVSVLRVDTSKDLRYARVFLSVFPIEEQPYVQATIKKELFRIQGLFNKKLHSKILPRLEFVIDQAQQNVEELEKVFEKIHKEDEQQS